MAPDAGEYRTYSPTPPGLGHICIFIVMTSLAWDGFIFNVTAAFVQGDELPADRELYMRLPRNWPPRVMKWLRQRLGPNARMDAVRILKGVFGLAESPRLWYDRVVNIMAQLGMRQCRLLPCVFAAHHPDGRLRAVLSLHVDDGLGTGDKTSHEIWAKLRSILNLGSWSALGTEAARFLGRTVRRESAGVVVLDIDLYTADIPLLAIPDREADSQCATEEVNRLRSVLGALGYASKNGRADLAFGVSECQQSLSTATVATLRSTDRLVRTAREGGRWVVKSLGCALSEVVFLGASDASFGAMPRSGSQAGYGVVLAAPGILEGTAPAVLAESVSARIKRVVRSSMAAEMCAASLAMEHTEFARAAWAELLLPAFELRAWRFWAAQWRLLLVIDAKTGFDVLEGEAAPSDHRVALDSAAMKEALEAPDGAAGVRWVPGPQHFADGLTKLNHNGMLESLLGGEGWSLREDAQFREQRASRRRRLASGGAEAAQPVAAGATGPREGVWLKRAGRGRGRAGRARACCSETLARPRA